jgi:phosphohistidine swiveling domain-containing protein
LAAALLLSAPVLPAAEPWTGVVEVAETISGPEAGGGDQKELERYAHVIEERLRQARDELPKAPPTVARVIREDIGFYEAERDRAVVAHGGELTIGRTYYQIKRERMAMVTDGARLIIDRGAGTVDGTVDGQAKSANLAPVPNPGALDSYTAGADYTLQDHLYHTRHVHFQVLTRTFDVDFAPGLPNPYAIGLVDAGDASDPAKVLATLPGMPIVIASKENGQDTVRSLRVVTIDQRDVSDDAFLP